MIKVTAVRIHFSGMVKVQFKSEITDVEVDKLPTVCLSRKKPGQCNYRVDQLADHDGHTPSHASIDEANTYIERVLSDIQDGLAANEVILETEKVDVKAVFLPPGFGKN